MKTALIVLLLLSTFVADGWSQEVRRGLGREPVRKVIIPPRPPVQTELVTMTGQHEYPQPVEPTGGLAVLVPMQLERLDPAITHARLFCDAVSTSYYQVNPLLLVARGSTEVELLNGVLADTVRVQFEALPNKDLARAGAYRCDLQLKTAGGWANAYDVAQTHPVDPSRPFKFAVVGELPRS